MSFFKVLYCLSRSLAVILESISLHLKYRANWLHPVVKSLCRDLPQTRYLESIDSRGGRIEDDFVELFGDVCRFLLRSYVLLEESIDLSLIDALSVFV